MRHQNVVLGSRGANDPLMEKRTVHLLPSQETDQRAPALCSFKPKMTSKGWIAADTTWREGDDRGVYDCKKCWNLWKSEHQKEPTR